jgi:methionyl-tRNA synthetase
MLLAAGVPLPRQVLGHGWVTFKGEKLSKSLGNIVEPLEVTAKYGPDPLRFYLLKEVPLDRDGDFTWDLFIERYNTELANDLGNLVSRSVTMAVKYFQGDVPSVCDLDARGPDAELLAVAERAVTGMRDAYERLAPDQGIAAAWTLVRRANQYIEETAPWKLAKDEGQRERLATVLNALLESVRLSALLLTPVIPGSCARIREGLKSEGSEEALSLQAAVWAPLENRPREPLTKPRPLFPRIEAADEA